MKNNEKQWKIVFVKSHLCTRKEKYQKNWYLWAYDHDFMNDSDQGWQKPFF